MSNGWKMQHPFPFPLCFWSLGNGWYDYECSWLKLTAVRTCSDTELSAGYNWKHLGALFIILLLLLVMWWILDSESKSQLTLILSTECTSVYTTQILLICVYSVYYITVDLEIFTFSWFAQTTKIKSTKYFTMGSHYSQKHFCLHSFTA